MKLPLFLGMMSALFAMCIIVKFANDQIDENRRLAVPAGKLRDHCAFERLNLEMMDQDLAGGRSRMRELAVSNFDDLAREDFREIKLCTPDGAWFDSEAVFCGRMFRYDIGCMRALVKLARIYVR